MKRCDSPPRARAALDRGDLAWLSNLHDQAESLRVPDRLSAPAIIRPWEVSLQVESAINRSRGVSPAAHLDPVPTGNERQWWTVPGLARTLRQQSRHDAKCITPKIKFRLRHGSTRRAGSRSRFGRRQVFRAKDGRVASGRSRKSAGRIP